jgi:hypothetical protein
MSHRMLPDIATGRNVPVFLKVKSQQIALMSASK